MLPDLLTSDQMPKLFVGQHCNYCGQQYTLFWRQHGYLCTCRMPTDWWWLMHTIVKEIKLQEQMRDVWTTEVANLREDVKALTEIIQKIRTRGPNRGK